jgi:peptide chain release factor 1
METGNSNQVAYLEIRGATGGDEAKLWGADLLRMYMRYGLKKGWKLVQMDEKTIRISGPGVFDALKNESGVHRVQRVPVTEKRGRIHTSTATVAVLPEVRETDVQIAPNELEWQFTTGGGHGGQNVNKVSTAVRLTHKPTGIVVQAREERFQEQNRQIALSLLRSKLWEREEEEKLRTIAGYRSAIGRGMRNEKIRTYNYPQDRVTDHRLGKSWGKLELIVDGDLDKIVELTKTLQ